MSEITKEDAYLRFNKELMRRVRVVAAVIKAVNEKGEPIIFAIQRGCGPLKGGWEFPSGKIEPGETQQEALKREIRFSPFHGLLLVRDRERRSCTERA